MAGSKNPHALAVGSVKEHILRILKDLDATDIAKLFDVEKEHTEHNGKVFTWEQLLENHHIDDFYENESGKVIDSSGLLILNSLVQPWDDTVIINDEYIVPIKLFVNLFPGTSVMWFD